MGIALRVRKGFRFQMGKGQGWNISLLFLTKAACKKQAMLAQ